MPRARVAERVGIVTASAWWGILPRTFSARGSGREAGVRSVGGMFILEGLIGIFAIAAIAATATTVAKDGYRRMPTRRY
jgi:hypothetical protein